MSNHASLYCKTLDNVTKDELVNALHQALMQLNAATKDPSQPWDHKPAIAEASRVLAKAGHMGFPVPAEPKGDWHFEHSSGYDGYRCFKCAEWVYIAAPRCCACDKVASLPPAPKNPIVIMP